MIIDLTVKLDDNTPVYPGDPKPVFKAASQFETVGYEDYLIFVGNHVGTHIDAPSHMIKGGKTLDKININTFFGNGICVNTGKDINLEKFKQSSISDGDIILIRTDMSEVYFEKEYYEEYPAIPKDVAAYLVEKKVKMVGVDMGSVDYEPFPVHKMFLQNEILIIENLTNLKALKSKEFKVFALPLNLTIDGSPARVIAEIDDL